jgi:hypothetical protein
MEAGRRVNHFVVHFGQRGKASLTGLDASGTSKHPAVLNEAQQGHVVGRHDE